MKKYLLAIGVTTALSTIAFCGVVNAKLATNGKSLNGTSLNGVSLNGTSLNGFTLQGTQLRSLKVEGGQLVAVQRVEVK
ncbi:hypothetical protein [Nostoc sp. PA-18-2419]|uniref:hypothetical protein n=1 Tax=Nostoc sp. PA-18-2419 TaxID=2575443 RepID=UPI001108AA32|nr:hypothetical protein [Nostoc sp. PA-18-2419]